MKKIKVVKNCMKWRENWSKIIFGLFSPPPKKIFCWPYNFFGQKWKKSKLLKNAWNGEKIGRKWFLNFLAPPPKIGFMGGIQKFVVKNEKNQSCSKFPEMARKFVNFYRQILPAAGKYDLMPPPPRCNYLHSWFLTSAISSTSLLTLLLPTLLICKH